MFFFSSRRRHTRWPRDWSSDVCSSDLVWIAGGISALVASVIVAPTLISNLIKGVGSKTGVKVTKDKSDRDVEHVRRDEGVKPSPADEAGFIPEVPEDDSDWRQSA